LVQTYVRSGGKTGKIHIQAAERQVKSSMVSDEDAKEKLSQ